ncbi:hypothetical protein L5515_010540 [Caenorhabditis briggsae]|uniref:Protein CBR-CKA-1 n=2 Tax=Caenorhabditis briggsae TaxID=6238 RepID=A0AAE9ACL0_CAEBR|nr:hypothetical protein L3Y34_003393 [Caenorhabditis briggsae]UMM27108.1 hypothetical protein L5515_010540 [Caenorhabditis briggsae]
MVSLEVPTETPGNSRRAASEECEIAFSHDDPTLMWKDRTTECVDLKKVFSKFDSSAPISGEILFRARFLCAKYLGGAWRKVKIEDFRIRAITGGMSNLLFLVELPAKIQPTQMEPEKALLRVHCQSDIDQLLSESVVFTLLSERNLGPKMLGVFPGGRFEQFIPSRALQCLEISKPGLSKLIAPIVARVHTLDAPIPKEPQTLQTARQWLDRFKKTPAGERPIEMYLTRADVPESDFQYPTTITVAQLERELNFVEFFLQHSNSPVVFSHNDLQEGNFLLIDGYQLADDGTVLTADGKPTDEDPLSLIDFEYCSYNYRGFDLGNHFCEYGYDYNESEPPYYKIHQHFFDVEDERKVFCEAYLDEVYKMRSSGDNPHFPSDLVTGDREKDLQKIIEESILFMPVSNIFWVCWSLINAEESSISFDYGAYGRDRLALYFHQKKALEKYLNNL